MGKSRPFITRCPEDAEFRLPTGQVVRKVKSDVTIGRLASGVYRCYKCPSASAGLSDRDSHWVTLDAAAATLHAVDHMIEGLAVPVKGLRNLAAVAVEARDG